MKSFENWKELCDYLEGKFGIDIDLNGVLFLIGIVFFSGSLYILATAELTGFPVAVAGPVTPMGGLFFIGGWATLIYAGVKNSQLSDK